MSALETMNPHRFTILEYALAALLEEKRFFEAAIRSPQTTDEDRDRNRERHTLRHLGCRGAVLDRGTEAGLTRPW